MRTVLVLVFAFSLSASLRADPPVARTLPGPAGTFLAFSPDGKTLLAGNEREVEAWDVATGRRRGGSLKAADAFSHLAVSPTGTSVAVASADGLVVWDYATAAVERRARAGAPIRAVAFSPSGQSVAVACGDGRVLRYDVGLDQFSTLYQGNGAANFCAFSPGGERLAVGSFRDPAPLIDGRSAYEAWKDQPTWLTVLRVSNGQKLWSLAGRDECTGPPKFHPAGRLLAVPAGRNVDLFDARTGDRVGYGALIASLVGVTNVDVGRDGRRIVASGWEDGGGEDGAVQLLEWPPGGGRNVGEPAYVDGFAPYRAIADAALVGGGPTVAVLAAPNFDPWQVTGLWTVAAPRTSWFGLRTVRNTKRVLDLSDDGRGGPRGVDTRLAVGGPGRRLVAISGHFPPPTDGADAPTYTRLWTLPPSLAP